MKPNCITDTYEESNQIIAALCDRLQNVIQASNQLREAAEGIPNRVESQLDVLEVSQATIDAALQTIQQLSNKPLLPAELNGGRSQVDLKIHSTVGAQSCVTQHHIYQVAMEENCNRQIEVEITERANPAELIVFRSGFLTQGDESVPVLENSLLMELSSHFGSELLTFQAGTSLLQMLAMINLFTDSTRVEATVLGKSLVLRTLDFGSSSFVEVSVLSEDSPHRFTKALSSTKAVGSDIEANVNGVPAYGDGLRLQLATANLEMEIHLDAAQQRDFQFTITGGGMRLYGGNGLTMGVPSLTTLELGNSHGRLFELGTGHSKCLTMEPNVTGIIASDTHRFLVRLRDRFIEFQTRLEDAQRQTQEASIEAQNAELASKMNAKSPKLVPIVAGKSVVTRNPARILVQAGPSLLEVPSLCESEMEVFLRR